MLASSRHSVGRGEAQRATSVPTNYAWNKLPPQAGGEGIPYKKKYILGVSILVPLRVFTQKVHSACGSFCGTFKDTELACEQVSCEGGKKFSERSVNPATKREGVGA